MTSPTDIPTPPQPQPEGQGDPPELRRTLRTESGEAWQIVTGEQRIGTVAIQYAPELVEGVLTLAGPVDPDNVRGVLGWVTDLLQLDGAAGPGGLIHWTVATGDVDEFWRRSPGRPPTGAENDLGTARIRVEQVLSQMFEQVQALPDGGYAVDTGSVRVFLQLRLVDTTVLCRVFSITNLGVKTDGDLAEFLLGANFTLALGRFSFDRAQQAVWFDHVLAADELDSALPRTIAAVAQTADQYDDQLKARYGGRTFREEGSPVEAAAAPGGMAGGYL
jgi:hypothetical protein